MPHRVRRVAGLLWFSFVAVASVTIVMVVAFLVVYTALTWRSRPIEGADQEKALLEAQVLRSCANELVLLAEEFSLHRTEATPTGAAEYARWLAEDYRPRLGEFRKRFSDALKESVALGKLMEATSKLDEASQAPTDKNIRASALKEVAEAVNGAEEQIGALGVGSDLTELPIPLSLHDIQ